MVPWCAFVSGVGGAFGLCAPGVAPGRAFVGAGFLAQGDIGLYAGRALRVDGCVRASAVLAFWIRGGARGLRGAVFHLVFGLSRWVALSAFVASGGLLGRADVSFMAQRMAPSAYDGFLVVRIDLA